MRKVQWIPWQARVTAYTEPAWGGASYGITASGVPAVPWVTIAAPKHIPFHTVINVPGFGVGVVQDRGGAIHGNHLDVCLPSRAQDFQWGVHHETVWVRTRRVVIQKRWVFKKYATLVKPNHTATDARVAQPRVEPFSHWATFATQFRYRVSLFRERHPSRKGLTFFLAFQSWSNLSSKHDV